MAARNSSGSAASKKKKPAGKRAPTKRAERDRAAARGAKRKPTNGTNGKKAKVASRKPTKRAIMNKMPVRKPTKKASQSKALERKATRRAASRDARTPLLRSPAVVAVEAAPGPGSDMRDGRATATLPIPSSTFFF